MLYSQKPLMKPTETPKSIPISSEFPHHKPLKPPSAFNNVANKIGAEYEVLYILSQADKIVLYLLLK